MAKHAQTDVVVPRGAGKGAAWALVTLVVLLVAAAAGWLLWFWQAGSTEPQQSAPSQALVRQAQETVLDQPASVTVDPTRSGWVSDDEGEMRYYDPQTHRLYEGWLEEDGQLLYIDGTTGQPHVGWLELEGKRYWLATGEGDLPRGALARETWLEQDGHRFYLTDDGSAAVGWCEVEGTTHYFDEDATLHYGWATAEDGSRRWMKSGTGTMAADEWVEVDGIWYVFDESGAQVRLDYDVVVPDDAEHVAQMSARQRAVVAACDTTPWPGKALCAGWVSNVFVNAGEPAVGGDACDIARAWCTSSDLSDLRPGMVIAVPSHPRTANGKIWGHICIYVGNGLVRDSGTYGVRRVELETWFAWFGASNTPKWGWANGISLA